MTKEIELYIRAEWRPKNPNDVTSEIARASKTIFSKDALRIIGSTWYRPERSGSTKPVPIAVEQLESGQGWVREELVKPQYMHRLVLANGSGGEAQAGISGTVFEGSPNPNQFVVRFPEPQVLRGATVDFQDVLSLAESYATALHGVAIVSSGDLFERANEYGLKTGSKAAYAAFWGARDVDANRLYKRLDERGIAVPYSLVAITSWPDLSVPDTKVIESIQELLS